MSLYTEEKQIRQYLLGTLAESEEQKIEEEILRNNDFAQQILLIEDELIEDYARCALGEQEHEQFERHFLTTPQRRRKLAFVHGLSKYASAQSKRLVAKQAASVQKPNRLRHLYQPSWKIGIYAVVVAFIAFGAWQFFIRNADVNQGLSALNKAYQAQRPIQSRVTGFSYAPFPDTRGAADEKVDERSRDLSGALLLKAVSEKQNPISLHALGRYYLLRKEFDKAIEQFDEAIKLSPQIAQIHSDLGAALLERGKADKAKGDYAQSGKDLGKSLEELTEALNLDPSLIEALFNRALCKQQLGLESRAEEDWKDYLNRDSKSEWAEEVRQQLKLLEEKRKKVQNNNDQLYADFIAAYKSRDGTKAWEAFRDGRLRVGNFITEKLIDEFLAAASNPAQIKSAPQIQLLKFAGEIESQTVGDRFTLDLANYYSSVTPSQIQRIIQARNLKKQAREQHSKSELDMALALYIKSRDEFQKAGDFCEASLVESYAVYSLAILNRPKESIALGEKLEQQFKIKNYKALQAYILGGLTYAYSDNNEWSRAIHYTELTLNLSREIDHRLSIFECLGALQGLHALLGKNEESFQNSLEAIKYAQSNSLVLPLNSLWAAYAGVSIAYLQMNYLIAALESQKEALYIATLANNPQAIAVFYSNLSFIEGNLHNYNNAIRNAHLSIEIAEKVKSEAIKLDLLLKSYFSLGHAYRQQGNFKEAIAYLNQSIPISEKTEFWYYLYLARRESFLSYFGLGDYEKAEIEIEKSLEVLNKHRNVIVEESNRNAFFDLSQDIYDDAIGFAYSNKRDFVGAFQYAEESRSRSLLDARQDSVQVIRTELQIELKLPSVSEPLSVTEIQRRLPDKAQIIQYAVLPDKLIIWAVSANNLIAVDSKITSKELTESVNNYLKLISTPANGLESRTAEQAKALYKIIIEPIEPYLDRKNTICIVPDGMLNALPFASLIAPGSGHYLIEDFTILESPSATNFILSSEQAKTKEQRDEERVVSIGNPRIDSSRFPNLQELPAASIEAEHVAALSPNSILLTGDRAKEESVRKAMLQADVIHIASHSLTDQKSPLLSKLLLSTPRSGEASVESSDGQLHAYELYQLKLKRPRLAVLSACQTGIGREYRGEGAISLIRPFIAAGVPVVVASYWNVDSTATMDLMVDFHRLRHQQHLSTTQALREAQLAMLRSNNKSLRNPSAWAAFAAFGGYTTY